jgi:hypothetical protein
VAKRLESGIAFGKRQFAGEFDLVAGEREFGKEDETGAFGGGQPG